MIEFSVFQKTARVDCDGLPPLVPLETIAYEGHCQIVGFSNKIFGGKKSKDYCSDLLFCPTWSELLDQALLSQKSTLDKHHVFLEGIYKLQNYKMGNIKIQVLRLQLGS